MHQHNKSKTRPDAPTKHQAMIQAKKGEAKTRIEHKEAVKAVYKAQRAVFLAPPLKPETGYEEFVNRPPTKAVKVANRATERLTKYTVATTD